MNPSYNLRDARDRERLAADLPQIDGVNYDMSRAEFLDVLATAVGVIAPGAALRYEGRVIPLFQTSVTIQNLVDLGRRLTKLRACEGFDVFTQGFTNPTQFWDSWFEARVASYFISCPGISALVFSPAVIVRGRRKHPDFAAVGAGGELLVECKQIRIADNKRARKFASDVRLIQRIQDSSSWPEDYCLEVDFLAAETRSMPELASALIDRAISAARKGGGEFQLDGMSVTVRHRDVPLRTDTSRRGLYRAVLRSPGYPVSLADARHMPLYAYRGDTERGISSSFKAP